MTKKKLTRIFPLPKPAFPPPHNLPPPSTGKTPLHALFPNVFPKEEFFGLNEKTMTLFTRQKREVLKDYFRLLLTPRNQQLYQSARALSYEERKFVFLNTNIPMFEEGRFQSARRIARRHRKYKRKREKARKKYKEHLRVTQHFDVAPPHPSKEERAITKILLANHMHALKRVSILQLRKMITTTTDKFKQPFNIEDL